MNGQIFFLIVLGLLLACANGKVSFSAGWLINPPMAVFLGVIMIANLMKRGPKIWQKLKHQIKSAR